MKKSGFDTNKNNDFGKQVLELAAIDAILTYDQMIKKEIREEKKKLKLQKKLKKLQKRTSKFKEKSKN